MAAAIAIAAIGFLCIVLTPLVGLGLFLLGVGIGMCVAGGL